jgi:hypothetical protein
MLMQVIRGGRVRKERGLRNQAEKERKKQRKEGRNMKVKDVQYSERMREIRDKHETYHGCEECQ